MGELLTYRGESNKRRFLVVVHDLVYFNGVGGLGIRVLTQSHLVDNHANRPDVAWVRVVLAVKAFRRHITKGTSVSTCDLRFRAIAQFFTDAKVRKLGSA